MENLILRFIFHLFYIIFYYFITFFIKFYNTPISRRLIKGEFAEEVRKIGRKILEENNTENN